MNDALCWFLSAGAGALLGAGYFCGLWWTVKKGTRSARPGAYFIASFGLRLGLATAGFAWVGGRDWHRLLACLAGFIAARAVIVRSVRIGSSGGLSRGPVVVFGGPGSREVPPHRAIEKEESHALEPR
jgi:F1F0 ATPase subunit 2